jgi:tetratricopeptide (TPR) repeat protein
MQPRPSFRLKPVGAANLYLSSLVLALVVGFGAGAQAAGQEPQAPAGVEQSDEGLTGGDADPSEPDLIEPEVIEPDEIEPDAIMRPDAKKGGNGSAPPHSTEESKQDKLDPSRDGLPIPPPLDRPKVLGQLYEQLGKARDADAAAPVMEAIEELWRVSGSDTVDLLMSRAERFVTERDLDLALRILDATVDIAPEDAEVWHRRATVHFLQREHELALADLRRALNLDPKHYRAINDLGVVLEEMGAKKEALEAYRKALAVNPFLEQSRQAVEVLSRDVEGQDI